MGLHETLAVLGAVLLIVALFSRVIDHVWLSPALVACLVGIVLGPEVVGLIRPAAIGDPLVVLRELARVTLAVALVGIGLQMTPDDLKRSAGAVVRLLAIGMPVMWLVTGVGAMLLLDIGVWGALVIGACLTPTDPAVASSLVTGDVARGSLPRRLRRTLQLESGANDGLAVPFFLLAALMVRPGGATVGEWAGRAMREVALAVIIGGALGFAAGWVARREFDRREVEPTHLVDAGVALAAVTLAVTHLVGGSGILAAFVAGLAFSVVLAADEREMIERSQIGVLHLLLIPMFVLFGASLPWGGWAELGPAAPAFAAWVLFLRRPLAGAASLAWRPPEDVRGVVWLSWFGPLGVAGIFYAAEASAFVGDAYPIVFDAATLAIFASVVVHGVTAAPGSHLYAGRPPFATLRHPLRPDA